MTLLQMTTSVMMTVLRWSWNFSGFRASRTGAGCKLVACIGGDSRPPGIGDELLALGAERHVLARLLRQPFAFGSVEDRLAHHAPDDARPEVVFAVKTLHPVDQFRPVESRVDHGRELMAHLIGHGVDRDQ